MKKFGYLLAGVALTIGAQRLAKQPKVNAWLKNKKEKLDKWVDEKRSAMKDEEAVEEEVAAPSEE